MNAQYCEIRRESITTKTAQTLMSELNAEILRRYPEDGIETHFHLEHDEVIEGRGAFLVVYGQDQPLGCGAVRLIDAGTAEIKRIYVVPSARGMGLGSQILATLEAEAKKLGASRVVLETGPRQPEAISLYAKVGYRQTAPFGNYGDPSLSVFMGKDI